MAKQVLITVMGFSSQGSVKNNVNVGDKLLLKKDPTNEKDTDCIQVYTEDGSDWVGVVGQSTAQAGCKTATEIQPFFEEETFVVVKNFTDINVATKNGGTRKTRGFICELTIEKREAKKMEREIRFKLIGSKSYYPNKIALMDALKNKMQPTVKLVRENDKIVAYFANGLCGYIDDKDENGLTPYKDVSALLKEERIAKIVERITTNFIGVFMVDEGQIESITTTKSLEAVLEKIVKEGLITQEEVDERVAYMRKYGVTSKQMASLFSSFKKYPEEVEKRISKPKTFYVDATGLLKRSIAYANLKRNLMFEGDRGVGKNVLTETLAWLYKRPLYEFPMNSQHDNNSLLGGKTVSSEDTENGQKVQMSYEPDVIVQAVENGGILVFDEFNTSLGHILSLFNSLLDDRRRLQVPGYKQVEADDNFFAVATQNKDYQGTFENNEATIDRFVPIIFPPLNSITDVLLAKMPFLSYEIVQQCDNLYKSIKKSVTDGEIGEKAISIRGFIDACMATEQDIPLEDALIDNIANKASDLDDRKAIKGLIDIL